MSADVPVQVVVAAFTEEGAAAEALEELKEAKRERLIGIQAAAVLTKDAYGKLHIKETADMGGGKGAALGGITGAAIGLIAGPALVVPAAVGALVGSLAAKWRDSGFSDSRLRKLGEGLTPGSSAIVAVVEHTWVAEVSDELAREGGDLLTEALKTDIALQLEAGHDVAYTALATQEGLATARATNEKTAVGDAKVVGEDHTVGSRYVATQEGFAVEPTAGSSA